MCIEICIQIFQSIEIFHCINVPNFFFRIHNILYIFSILFAEEIYEFDKNILWIKLISAFIQIFPLSAPYFPFATFQNAHTEIHHTLGRHLELIHIHILYMKNPTNYFLYGNKLNSQNMFWQRVWIRERERTGRKNTLNAEREEKLIIYIPQKSSFDFIVFHA